MSQDRHKHMAKWEWEEHKRRRNSLGIPMMAIICSSGSTQQTRDYGKPGGRCRGWRNLERMVLRYGWGLGKLEVRVSELVWF